jgi:cytochrome c
MMKYTVPGMGTIYIGQKANEYLSFKQIDLTGIESIVFVASAPAQYGMTGGTVEVRLDSPTGELIGTSELIKPSAGKEQMPPPAIVKAKLKPTSGIRDVFYVLKNEKANGMTLFALIQIRYQNNPKVTSSKQQISMR